MDRVYILAALSLLTSCTAAAEIVVVVDTNIAIADAFVIDVTFPSGVRARSDADLTTQAPPRTLVLVHQGGALEPVTLRIGAIREGSEIVVVDRVVAFGPGTTRTLQVFLEADCRDAVCAMEETCGNDGACRAPGVADCEYEGGACADAGMDAGPGDDAGADAAVDDAATDDAALDDAALDDAATDGGVCTADTCGGCCSGGGCVDPTTASSCGVDGQECRACDITTDTCGSDGECHCAAQDPCEMGQHCVLGVCICDATSCPTGCCKGDACAPSGIDSCGTAGSTCADCTMDGRGDGCSRTGTCTCGGGPLCPPGQRCSGVGGCSG